MSFLEANWCLFTAFLTTRSWGDSEVMRWQRGHEVTALVL